MAQDSESQQLERHGQKRRAVALRRAFGDEAIRSPAVGLVESRH